jgi:hypothetical protein
MVFIPLKEFVKEHKNLIPLLMRGTPAQRKMEAMKQMRELKKVMSK